MKHGVHEQKSVRVVHQLRPGECVMSLEVRFVLWQLEQVVGGILDVAVRSNEEAASAGSGGLE